MTIAFAKQKLTSPLQEQLKKPITSYPPLSLGSFLFRDYTVYTQLPLTTQQATSANWVQNTTTCDPNLGIRWEQSSGIVKESTPISLFFTPSGQVAGIGMTIYGDVFPSLVTEGYLQPLGVQHTYEAYFISVTFRNSSVICSAENSTETLGDTLIINANNISVQIPLTEQQAINGDWSRGSCFSAMGWHYFYDLYSAPNMSWVGANLLPIVPMYFDGVINAFFFASGIEQQSLFSANQWDPIPLPDFLMCENWCDSSCTFNDTDTWSTAHIFLNNYTTVTCPGGCGTACCQY